MPRITPKEYLTRRQFLRELWQEGVAVYFAALPPARQRDLHDYFALTEPFTDAEALRHRTAITKAFPSLPQQAGRAYEALLAHYEGRPSKTVDDYLTYPLLDELSPGNRRGKNCRVRALPLARPKVDCYRLAHALLELAMKQEGQKLYEAARRGATRKRPPRG